MPGLPSVRIVILNYNGEELLPQCLPSIVSAAKKSRFPVVVTVLDNLSRDKGLEYAATFPEVEIVKAPANRILCSYNDYLPEVKEPIVILLNNDIRVDENFIDPLAQKFVDEPSAFLAAPRVMSFDGKTTEAARAKSGLKFGMFWCDARYKGYEREAGEPSETFSSGFGAFSREKFLKLGGYDSRFHPGIFEDVDLCLRAGRAGYKLFYVPSSRVYHMGQASFKKVFGAHGISKIAHRNSFLFMWKNFSGPSFWLNHLFFLPLRLCYAAIRGQWTFISGFFDALKTQRKFHELRST